MKQHVDRATRWIYSGIWSVLVDWFKVPDHPPELPGGHAHAARSFRPADGFLRYLKFYFWIGLAIIDVLILIGWLALAISFPVAGAILALPALALAILPDIVAYIAIHLRYDTTWYVISDRSLRIRRGIWILHETTITYENIQNIRVTQGPLQRAFGIADVLVETAGGGAGSSGELGASTMHRGLIEGVDNAQEIRDLILAHLRKTRTTGLGDDHDPTLHHSPRSAPALPAAPLVSPSPYGLVASATRTPAWTPDQLSLLREIRNTARTLAET